MRPGSASAGTLRAISRPRYQSLCLLPSYCAAANQLATLLVCAPPTTLGRRRVVRIEPRWKEKTVMADCGARRLVGGGEVDGGSLGRAPGADLTTNFRDLLLSVTLYLNLQ